MVPPGVRAVAAPQLVLVCGGVSAKLRSKMPSQRSLATATTTVLVTFWSFPKTASGPDAARQLVTPQVSSTRTSGCQSVPNRPPVAVALTTSALRGGTATL